MLVIKKEAKRVSAYRLGTESSAIDFLIARGLVKRRKDGNYEVFSRESMDGSGQIAKPGDYIKVDSEGYPYPNEETFFLQNHRQISDDVYEQFPKPLEAWSVEEPENDVIRFLKENKGLAFDAKTPEHLFSAPLWGTIESAAQDAVIVFYRVERDVTGKIIDVDYNFVARSEFTKSYLVC